jgi:hypothetical protein
MMSSVRVNRQRSCNEGGLATNKCMQWVYHVMLAYVYAMLQCVQVAPAALQQCLCCMYAEYP